MKQSSGFVELHNGPPGVKKNVPQEFLYALGVGPSPKGLLTPLRVSIVIELMAMTMITIDLFQ